MQFPIIIGLHRSRLMDALVLLTALLSSAATIEFPRPPSIQMALVGAIWVLALLAWRRLKPSIKEIRLERNGDIFLAQPGDSSFLQASPEPSATVHPWLTVLRLKTADGRRITLIATVDSQKAENFRRLRMFLRWQANFNAPDDDA